MAGDENLMGLLDLAQRRREEERRLNEQMVEELVDVNQAANEFEVVQEEADSSMIQNLQRQAESTSSFAAEQAQVLDQLLIESNELTDAMHSPLRRQMEPLIQLFAPEDSIQGRTASIRGKQTQIAVQRSKQDLINEELRLERERLSAEVNRARNRVSGQAQDVEHVQNLLIANDQMRATEEQAVADFVRLGDDAAIRQGVKEGSIPKELAEEELAARETRRIQSSLNRINFAHERYRNASDEDRKQMIKDGTVTERAAKRIKRGERAQELAVESAEFQALNNRIRGKSDQQLLEMAEKGEISPTTAQQVIEGRSRQRTADERSAIAAERERRVLRLDNIRRLENSDLEKALSDPVQLGSLGVTRREVEEELAERRGTARTRSHARFQEHASRQQFIQRQLLAADDKDLDNPQSSIMRLATPRQINEEKIRRANMDLAFNQTLQNAAATDRAAHEQLRQQLLRNMPLPMVREAITQAQATGGVTTVGTYTFSFNELDDRMKQLIGVETQQVVENSTAERAQISMESATQSATRALGMPETGVSMEAELNQIIESPMASPEMKAAASDALSARRMMETNLSSTAKVQVAAITEEALREAAEFEQKRKMARTPKARRDAATEYMLTGRVDTLSFAYDAIGSQVIDGSTGSGLHDTALSYINSKLASGNTSSDLIAAALTGADDQAVSGTVIRQLMQDERTSSELSGTVAAYANRQIYEDAARATNDIELLEMLRTGSPAIYDPNGALNVSDMFTFMNTREGPQNLENYLAKVRELAPSTFKRITTGGGPSIESISSLNRILYSGQSPTIWHSQVLDFNIRENQARSIRTQRGELSRPALDEPLAIP